MKTKKLFIALGCIAALELTAFGIFAACENHVEQVARALENEFPDEEYGEDWEWPELTALVLNKTAVTLRVDETDKLTATVDGEAAEAWWMSNKPATVSVSEDGTITALGQGTALIKGTAKAGGHTGMCEVTVKVSQAGLYRNDEPAPMNLSETAGNNLLIQAFAWIKANNDSEGTEYTIVLGGDVSDSTTSGFVIGTGAGDNSSTGKDAADKNLTITLQGLDETRTITKGAAGPLFTVYGSTNDSDTPHLILGENITLAGYASNNKALVVVGDSTNSGKLTMRDGSRITGNKNSTAQGGGVYVVIGLFNMEGGTIDANASTQNGGKGGGVFNGGTFTMLNGLIEENEAGNSSGGSNSSGGGVYNGNQGVFLMEDGIIRNNKALAKSGSISDGGGVFAAKFTMKGGSIKGNTAVLGGGIEISSNAASYFTMEGGAIAGNTASTKGAAVFLYKYGTFNKTGGTIYGTNDGDLSNKGETSIHSIEMGNGATAATNPAVAWYDSKHDTGTLSYKWTTGSITWSTDKYTTTNADIEASDEWSKTTVQAND
jgi:hypothetical protein